MSNDNLKETIRTILMRRAYDPWRVELEATEIAALVQPLVDERDALKTRADEQLSAINAAQLVLDKNSIAPRGPLADRITSALAEKIAEIVEAHDELRSAQSSFQDAQAALDRRLRSNDPAAGSIAYRVERMLDARDAEIADLGMRLGLAVKSERDARKDLAELRKRLEAWQNAVADTRDVFRPYPEYDDGKKPADLAREILSRKDAEIAELKKHQHVVHIGVDLEKSDTVVSKMRELEQRAKVAEEKATAFASELETVRCERGAKQSLATAEAGLNEALCAQIARVTAERDRARDAIDEAHAILDRSSGIKRCALPDRLRMAFTEKAAAAVALADELEALKTKHRAAVVEINKAVASLQTFPTAAPEAKPAAPKNVVVKVTHGDRILLVRHVDRGWGLPGGAIMHGEKESDAALRELKEETGIDGSRLALRGWTGLDSPELGSTMVFNCEASLMFSLAPNDPDGKIVNAIWARREDVAGIHRMGFLSELPSRSMILQWAGL